MKLRCGLKNNLPQVALAGEPLVTTDTQEMYVGTGTGIKKISDMVVSVTEPTIEDRLKLWIDPTTGIVKAYIQGVWEAVANEQNTDFGTF